MKTALFIHSYAAANEMVARHWPYWKRSGWDIFGVGRIGGKCQWPEPVPSRDIGIDEYINGDNLPCRLLLTYEWFVKDARFKDYTHACIVEPDTIFLKPAPVMEVAVAAHLSGFRQEGYQAAHFYHCPWWLDRVHALAFIPQACQLIEQGQIERGTPDYFFAWVWETLNIPVYNLPGTFSQNALDLDVPRILCRDLIRQDQLWFVHGVKTEAQLQEILS